ENLRCAHECVAERAHETEPALETDERILVADLERLRELGRIQLAQRARVDAQRVLLWLRREQPRAKRPVARDREPLGATELLAAAGLAEPPGVAGTCIEQHGDGDEIDPDPRALVGWLLLDELVEHRHAVASAGPEVIHAAVDRDVERRVLRARDR